MRGLNQCGICGRFKRWEDLDFHQTFDMDLHGNLTEVTWAECQDGATCLQPPKDFVL